MSVKSLKLTVATTATPLAPGHRRGVSMHDPVWVEVYNPGPATVYFGGADVTTADGRPVAAGKSWSFPLSHGDDLYGVTASGTQDVYVFRGRQ